MKKNLKAFIIMIALSAFILSVGINKVYAETYTNYDPNEASVSCGSISGIPSILPKLISVIYVIIQIAIPVLLVILGMIDLLKAVSANKEDELNKARGMFFKRVVSAVLVFFVMAIVKLVIGAVSKGSDGLIECLDCFIDNKCNTNATSTCSLGGYDLIINDNKATFASEELRKNGYYIRNSEFVKKSNSVCPNPNQYELKSIPNTNGYDIVAK